MHPPPICPPPSPVEVMKGVVRLLGFVFTMLVTNGRLKQPLRMRIDARIYKIKERLTALAERVAAGTYRPRPERKPGDMPRKTPATPPNPPPADSPFRQRGWLAAVLPADYAQQLRAHLHHGLRKPEMVALVEAAPVPMKRLLRPLCYGVGIKPPPILALPKRPRKPRPPRLEKRKRRRPAKPLGPMPASTWAYTPSAQWPRGVGGPPLPVPKSQKRS
jgi:hypothetical protein